MEEREEDYIQGYTTPHEAKLDLELRKACLRRHAEGQNSGYSTALGLIHDTYRSIEEAISFHINPRITFNELDELMLQALNRDFERVLEVLRSKVNSPSSHDDEINHQLKIAKRIIDKIGDLNLSTDELEAELEIVVNNLQSSLRKCA